MKLYHESRVEPADIDHLGHMNVRIYARKSATGVRAILSAAGLDGDRLEQLGARLDLFDAHTRFRREQLEGARLALRAGILEAGADSILTYSELFNVDTGDLSATFHHRMRLRSRDGGMPVSFPGDLVGNAEALVIERPEHGAPRSLPLDPMREDLTRAELEGRGVGVRFKSYRVEPEDCLPEGVMDLSDGKWVAFARMPINMKSSGNPDHEPLFSGGTTGIATLEARHHVFAAPRSGDTVVTHTGLAGVTEKLVRIGHWTFSESTGAPLAALIETGIGFDLEARKAIPFPPEMRARLERDSHPELI